ncbi:MAG TPA: DapH/DapD/GlmU-related protein [Trebonia sp.]|jgi:2,3,4,5-tetrahydropyridine-2-carboxylate N-succinyltransferase|nr:DapH/DapD/GlmU-related protein [Trebonia sp.]
MSESAWGEAVVTAGRDGTPLCAWFPAPKLGTPGNVGSESPADSDQYEDEVRGVLVSRRSYAIADLDKPPADTADGYLRLHLLSHRLVRPNSINLDGIFAVLPNVCWTSLGPVAASEIDAARQRALERGQYLWVRAVDKFPAMLDFVVPAGVRVADAARVRLGAYLAEGTTVMHEGFVNFNAGTLGPVMVEGRISQGVTVGAGADVGGGASIMGTLSGGGTRVISVGQRCLLGANSGLGISLGDDCVVEAGLYLTAGTIVTLPGGKQAKARDLSGQPGMLFRRNSVTGSVEAIPRHGTWGSLSADLHAHQ